MFGFYGVGVVMFVLQRVGISVVFVRCVLARVLWFLCTLGGCGFHHLILILCVVHKCGFVLVVSMGSLGD